MNELKNIVEQFQVQSEVSEVKPLGEGFINDTFYVSTANGGPDYLLQRKNKDIFKDIPSMMNNIKIVTNHLKDKIISQGGDPDREAMTITLSKDNKLYYQDKDGEYWAMCVFIKDSITHEAAGTKELAYAGGKGIGLFQSMLADMKTPLTNILPGFHDIKYRFTQWEEVLKEDRVGRKREVRKEIMWIESRKEQMLNFWKLVENGEIPTRVTHNDTKINNILFDDKGEVLCVIDLDTVLNSTVLNDFGDAIRSYANNGAEDAIDLKTVSVNLDIFKGFAQGYLENSIQFLNEKELEYLAFSALYITYEQVLRFLMDYIDGDRYYKTKSAKHNLVRTHAQFKLLSSMEENFNQMEGIIKDIVNSLKK
ncbi:aminoglycoside phosphotransferase family protein [Labilibacter sediminis]|nr:aminoglycoside phosphotransferase family protein [Labilibacter sediminis]